MKTLDKACAVVLLMGRLDLLIENKKKHDVLSENNLPSSFNLKETDKEIEEIINKLEVYLK